MAFKGSVLHVPAERRGKRKRQAQPPTDTPRQMYITLGNGRTLTFDNFEDLTRFALSRGWRPK